MEGFSIVNGIKSNVVPLIVNTFEIRRRDFYVRIVLREEATTIFLILSLQTRMKGLTFVTIRTSVITTLSLRMSSQGGPEIGSEKCRLRERVFLQRFLSIASGTDYKSYGLSLL